MKGLVLLGNMTVPLYGASSGVVDLGGGGYNPRAIVPQADLRSNSTYRLGLSLNKCSSDAVGTNLAAAITAGSTDGNFSDTNQPKNDAVEIVSDSAADVGQLVTVWGTDYTTGLVKKQTGTLNGTSVSTNQTIYSDGISGSANWNYILGVSLSGVCAGTITVRKASTNAAICTIATGTLTNGVASIAEPGARLYGLPMRAVAGAASTRIVGVEGINAAGIAVYDSVTLNGTAAVDGHYPISWAKKLLYGAAATNTQVTFTVGELTFTSAQATIGDLGDDEPTQMEIPPMCRYLHWCFYNGTTATAGGAYDNLIIKLYG